MRSIYLSILCYKELAHVIMEAEKSRTYIDRSLETQEKQWYRSSLSARVQEPGELML